MPKRDSVEAYVSTAGLLSKVPVVVQLRSLLEGTIAILLGSHLGKNFRDAFAAVEI